MASAPALNTVLAGLPFVFAEELVPVLTEADLVL